MKYIDFVKPKNEIIDFLKDNNLYTDSSIIDSSISDGFCNLINIKKAFKFEAVKSYALVHAIISQIIACEQDIEYVVEDLNSQIEYTVNKDFVLLNLETFLAAYTQNAIEFQTIINNAREIKKLDNFLLKTTSNFIYSVFWLNFKQSFGEDRPSHLFHPKLSKRNSENIIMEDIYKFYLKNRDDIHQKMQGIETKGHFAAIISLLKKDSMGLGWSSNLIFHVWNIISSKKNRKDTR